MAITDVLVPQLSESISEATLLEWKKQPGEMVQADEILIEVETDKVVLEVPAPASGRGRDLRRRRLPGSGAVAQPDAAGTERRGDAIQVDGHDDDGGAKSHASVNARRAGNLRDVSRSRGRRRPGCRRRRAPGRRDGGPGRWRRGVRKA